MMKKLLLICWVLLVPAFAIGTFAQQTVSGTVTSSEDNTPLPGVNIVIKGSSIGTVSDIDGNFNLDVGPDNSDPVLVFSYVGFLNEEIRLNGQTQISVSLMPDLQKLDEVVVIGYGVQKKSDLTGSVASVSVEDLQKIPNRGVSSMLQGMAAGVQVLQNSGQPGSEPEIRIRGLATINGGSPLIVIDGITGGELSDVNPADIASIEVLKDAASQSIYGAAGGNGVIIITTKKGEEGKFRVNLDVYGGIQKPWSTESEIANSQEYAGLYNAYQQSVGFEDYFPLENGQYLNPETGEILENTDWINEIFRTAAVQNYNLSVSGGNRISNFFMGANYNKEEGTVKKTSNEKMSFRLNSSHKFLNRFTIGENFSITESNYISQDERNEYNSPLSTSLQMLPFIPVYAADSSGNFEYRNAGLSANIKNPMAQIEYNNNTAKTQTLSGNVFLKIDVLKGLTFETRYGMRYNPYEFRKYVPAHTIGSEGNTSASQSITNSEYSFNTNESKSWQFQSFMNYDVNIGDNQNLQITAGFESSEYEYTFTNRTKYYNPDSLAFDPDAWESFSDAEDLTPLQDPKSTPSSSYSYFARLNYNFQDIYLLQANIRRDASSKFGVNKRFGVFPSVSVGIKFSEYDIIKNLNFINFGKIRAGYGETGNSDIQPFQDRSLIGSIPMHGYPFGNQIVPGAALITAGNTDLSWETVVTKNLGVDLRFLDNRLDLSFDVFQRENQDMLIRKSVPLTAGYYVSDPLNELGDSEIDTRPLANYGTLNNKGFEISATYKSQAGEFKYSVNANITRAITTIEDIGDPLYEGTGRGVSNICQTKNGGPVSAFYGYKTDGIYQEEDVTWYQQPTGRWSRIVNDPNAAIAVPGLDSEGNEVEYHTKQLNLLPGMMRYLDLGGDTLGGPDGKIDASDMVQIGDPNPDFTFGFGANFEYKGFDLGLFFQGSYGNDIFNLMKVNSYNIANGGLNISSELQKAFTPATYDNSNREAAPVLLTPAENTNSGLKRMDSKLESSDFFVEDGSYLRLKNAQIGYTFPTSAFEKVKIQRLRIYVSAVNLLTFTKYTGFDPEVNETSILERGFDKGTYPQSQLFTIGANLNF